MGSHAWQERSRSIEFRGIRIVLGSMLIAVFLTGSPVYAQVDLPSRDSLLVSQISFSGNQAWSDGVLRSIITSIESPGAFWSFIYTYISERFGKEPHYFDPAQFQKDQELLRQYYMNNGYFDASVTGEVTLEPDSMSVRLRYDVIEGQVSLIDSIVMKNVDRLPEDVRTLISQRSMLRLGDRYSAEKVQAEIQRILSVMGDQGYPNAVSDSVVVERKLSNNNVTIRLPFYFGRRLYFGPIREELLGVDELNLSRQIVWDRLDFREGDLYSVAKKDQGVVNVSRLGIFTNVQLKSTLPGVKDTTTRVPMILQVSPKRKHELAPALLVNNQSGRLNGGAELSYLFRNAFGGAQIITSKFNFLSKVPSVSFSPFSVPIENYQAGFQVRLDQPYFSDNATSFYFATAYTRIDEKDLFFGSLMQIQTGFRRFFTPQTTGFVDWTLEQTNFTAQYQKEMLDSRTTDLFVSRYNGFNSIITLTLDLDHTNDVFNPTSGWFVKGIFEEAGLLTLALKGAVKDLNPTEYVKTEFLGKRYWDLSRNRTTIGAAKFRLGGIFRWGESKSSNRPVPFNRRYYAGGTTSIRAWTSRALGQDTLVSALGGNGLLETSVELRWKPFPGAAKVLFFEPDLVWVAVFADAGNVWRELANLSGASTAISVGIGIRYNVIVPIRIDYAFRVYDPMAADHRWITERRFFPETFSKGIIQFGIGQAF